MSSLKISAGVLQRVSEFLADLPEEHLEDLAEGRARLAFVPVDATVPVVPGRRTPSRARAAAKPFEPSEATKDLIAYLETIQSRVEAAPVVQPLKKAALVDAAKALSVPGAGGLGMAELRLQIVEATVGRRLDSIAIRGFEGLRP